ncbi:LacI family DNA-binding transcriptional regulator [Sphingomonas liriopis]|nr:substrate-binding domain-containing protein [Sphingomonas liriopis]
MPSAHIDNALPAGLAGDTLYDAGRRDIGVITGPLVSPLSRNCLVGVRASAERHGLSVRLQIRRGDFFPESGQRTAAEIIKAERPPTAIFSFRDEMAIGALAASRAAELSCPDDMSGVGFVDIAMARCRAPSLTAIRQPVCCIGRRTVGLLLAILARPSAPPASVTLPHRLIVRQSVAVHREP